LEEAMYDFLNSWLVEQQPNQAVAYISPRAYPCIDQVASDEKKKINPGLIPHYILEGIRIDCGHTSKCEDNLLLNAVLARSKGI
jgi:hypothetical protein